MINFSIINIDGARGIGIDTQINMLRKYLEDSGKKVSLTYLKSFNSIKAENQGIKQFLETNPDYVIISEGSFARIMAKDIISGLNFKIIDEKYRDYINDYITLKYKYNMINIVLTPENIEFCNERTIKKNRLMGIESKGIENFQLEADIVNIMENFNNNTILNQLNFAVVYVKEKDSILEVHDKILKKLEGK
ncbi:MAG: hypothetical protein PHF86_09630 [Candidatus Nanoarchaeia archaeon]|nr:hypothetical protein [Candidatus Nanoarchaeia archaeon]